jgi:hypothetical protein
MLLVGGRIRNMHNQANPQSWVPRREPSHEERVPADTKRVELATDALHPVTQERIDSKSCRCHTTLTENLLTVIP